MESITDSQITQQQTHTKSNKEKSKDIYSKGDRRITYSLASESFAT